MAWRIVPRNRDVVLMLRSMKPPGLKHEVGVREFRDHLGRYVRHAAEGGEVVVTMRGTPVARMAPVAALTDLLAELRARGLVSEPEGVWQPRKRRRVAAAASVSDLVAEQRR